MIFLAACQKDACPDNTIINFRLEFIDGQGENVTDSLNDKTVALRLSQIPGLAWYSTFKYESTANQFIGQWTHNCERADKRIVLAYEKGGQEYSSEDTFTLVFTDTQDDCPACTITELTAADRANIIEKEDYFLIQIEY